MVAVIQRVTSCRVTVSGEQAALIGKGLLVLLGVAKNDRREDATEMAEKICQLRVMSDEASKMNKSLADVNGELLVVSQFTLLSDTSAGRRPSFIQAAGKDLAKQCYLAFVSRAKMLGIPTQTGRFGEYMEVSLVNDGPVTIIVTSDK